MKRTAIVLAVILAILLLIPLLAPAVLSTPGGRERFVALINRNIPGSVSIKKLQLSWFSHQEIQGLELRDPEGRIVIALEQIVSDSPLYRLLSKVPNLTNSSITGLKGTLIQEAEGLTNLHRALGLDISNESDKPLTPKKAPRALTIRVPFQGMLTVVDSDVKWLGNDMDPLEITDLHLIMHSTSAVGPLQIGFKGNSRQKDLKGTFVVRGFLDGFNRNSQIVLQNSNEGWPLPVGEGKIQWDVSVNQLAVDVIDRLLTFRHPHFAGAITEAIGPSLDLNLKQTLSKHGLSIALKANSKNVTASVTTQMRDGKIVLREPGQLEWTLTPQFAKWISPTAPNSQERLFSLLGDVRFQAVLERLEFVPGSQAPDVFTSPIHLRWNLQDGQVALASNQTLQISDCHGSIERSAASHTLMSQVAAKVSSGGASTDITLNGQWTDLIRLQGEIDLAVTHLPSAFFNLWTQDQALAADALGESVDLHVKVKPAEDGQGHLLDAQIASEQLTVPSLRFSWGTSLTLLDPAQFHYHVSPALLKRLFGQTEVVLKETVPILLTIEQFQLPIAKHIDPLTSTFKIHVSAAPVPVAIGAGGANFQESRLTHLHLELHGSPTQWKYQLAGNVLPEGSSSLLIPIIGKSVNVILDGSLAWKNGAMNGHQIQVALNSALIDFRATAELSAAYRLHLVFPATLHYTLQPSALESVGLKKDQIATLTSPALLDTVFETLEFPLDALSLDTLQISGRGSIDEINVHDPVTGSVATCKDLRSSWNFDGPNHEMTATMKGLTSVGSNAAGTLAAVIKAQGWSQEGKTDWSKATVNAKGSLLDVPVALASAASGLSDLPLLIGPTLNVYFVGKLTPENATSRGVAEFSLSGEGIAAGFALTLTDKVAFKEGGTALQWTVTPSRFAALQRLATGKAPVWGITQPTTLDVKALQMTIPLSDTEPRAWTHLNAILRATLGPVTMTHVANGVKSQFNGLQLDIETANLAERVTFALEGKEFGEAVVNAPGSFEVKGTLSDLWRNERLTTFKESTLGLTFKGRQLPLSLLQASALLDTVYAEHLQAVFGTRIDADIQLNKARDAGAVTANLRGQQETRFSVDGRFNSQRFTLAQPLVLEFRIAPGISQTLLADLLPLFQTALSSDQPVRLTIDAEGFAMPLENITERNIRIGAATLNLGRVYFHDSGSLASVVSLLDSSKGSGMGQFPVWFTPIYFSLIDGVFRIERVDAQIADKYPIAVWGKVDLPRDRVNIAIGVTAQALRASYGLTNLDPNYMLLLSLSGTTKNASIDKTKAATRITSLVAQSQGGPQGLIIGGVLDLIGGGFDESRIPPPTSRRPWESEAERTALLSQPPRPEPAKIVLPLDSIQKGIERGASQLLKFFR